MQRMRFVTGAASTRKTRGSKGQSRSRSRKPRMTFLVTPTFNSCPRATTPCWRRANNCRIRSISFEFTVVSNGLELTASVTGVTPNEALKRSPENRRRG